MCGWCGCALWYVCMVYVCACWPISSLQTWPLSCCRNPYFMKLNRVVFLYTQHSRTVPVLSISECALLFLLYMLCPRVDYPPLVLHYSSKTPERLLQLHFMISASLYVPPVSLCCWLARSHPGAILSHWDLYNFPKEMNRQEVRETSVYSEIQQSLFTVWVQICILGYRLMH